MLYSSNLWESCIRPRHFFNDVTIHATRPRSSPSPTVSPSFPGDFRGGDFDLQQSGTRGFASENFLGNFFECYVRKTLVLAFPLAKIAGNVEYPRGNMTFPGDIRHSPSFPGSPVPGDFPAGIPGDRGFEGSDSPRGRGRQKPSPLHLCCPRR